jgi:hypothetical protein
MSIYKKLVALLVLCLVLSSVAMADILKIEGGDAAVVIMDNRPNRGMNQLQVLELYGEPALRNAAVGQPPISSWDYNSFSVFFEGEYVLHTVNHESRESAQ